MGVVAAIAWRFKGPIFVVLAGLAIAWHYFGLRSTIETQALAITQLSARAVELHQGYTREVEARKFVEAAHRTYRASVAGSVRRADETLRAVAVLERESPAAAVVLNTRLPDAVYERLRNDRPAPASAGRDDTATAVDD